MKTLKKITTLLLFIATLANKNAITSNTYNFTCPEKKIIVIIPSYNNKKWYVENLDSVRIQNYNNYEVIYIDDCSGDRTGQLVDDYIKKYNLQEKFTLICNKKRKGALENLYNAIHSCDNEDIVITLDGDDWLAHTNVLKIINSVYQNPNVWLTYGQYEAIEGQWWKCTDYSEKQINENDFRNSPAFISHLRTFYAGLFKLIKIEDLLYLGEFYPMTWDKAIMLPMIEMSGGKFKRIEDILYIYNDTNPINDHKVDKELQRNLNDEILHKKPYKSVAWKNVINAKK